MTSPKPSLSSFGIDEELKRKLGFTLLAILIYRVGAHIIAPGVNTAALQAFINNNAGTSTFFQLYDTLGGGLYRATIFALGIMPYISASIIFQLMGGVFPTVSKMQKDEEGKKRLTQWTRYAAIAIAFSQAVTFTAFVETIPGAMAGTLVARITMWFTLTVGAIFMMWLGEQITERGIGNGMSLLIAVSILERFWPTGFQMAEQIRVGAISFGVAILVVAMAVGAIAAVVAMTIAARRIPIQIPRKVMGRGRIREGQKTFIPIRLITAGVMPIIFAQTIIIVPSTIATFTQNEGLREIATFFTPGDWPYDLVFGVMVVLFSYFYTSIIFNAVDLSENLKKQGGFVPGVRPGAATADYIDQVLGRITLPGSLFLALIALIPTIIGRQFNYQSAFGGTSVLIVVGVLLDTIAQIEQHRQLRKYDSFMKTGRVKFRGRQQRFI